MSSNTCRLSLVSFLALSACGGPRPGQAPEGDPTAYCARDTDCSPEQYCNSGVCADRQGGVNGCDSHTDCDFGEFCRVATGLCVECLNSDHCGAGEICKSDGTCGAADTGCTSDAQCAGLHCLQATGDCVQCLSSSQCPLGQTCRENACFTNTGGGGGGGTTCNTQADCNYMGLICNSTSHTCVACTSDTQCGTGKRCAAGTCTDIPGGGTGGTGGGTPGGACEDKADCGGMPCFLSMCMPCFSDFMCFSLEDLMSGTSTICDTDTGECVAPECNDANQCPAGEGCYSGHCGPCMEDSECRSGQVCNADTGVCGTSSGGGGGTTSCPGGCDDGNACTTDTCSSTGTCSHTPISPCGNGTQQLGQSCSDAATCAAGLTCLDSNGVKLCTRPCIGSGDGGEADCPLGNACYDFESGPLDGAKLCVDDSQLASTTPGHGFTQAPGASCASGNDCQTGVCMGDQTCARACLADRDCDADEVCYGEWADAETVTGYHLCYFSDPVAYTPAGGACNNGLECDSGVCVGTCDNGSLCNSDAECFFGSCVGTCADHCRSNADCGSGDACAPWPMVVTYDNTYSSFVPVCMDKVYSGTQADGTACTSDGQCQSDWCQGGICTTPCGTSADCTGGLAGKKCTLRTFSDDTASITYAMSFCQ